MAAGESQITIYPQYRIFQPVVGRIIQRVSKAILRRLSPEFMTVCILNDRVRLDYLPEEMPGSLYHNFKGGFKGDCIPMPGIMP